MAEIFDPEQILTMKYFRATGEGEEIAKELAEEAGFGVPVFIIQSLYDELLPDSVTANFGISRQQNIIDTLRLLFRLSQTAEDNTVIFETAVPHWNPQYMGFEAKGLTLAATLFTAKDSPFIVISHYGDVRDIFEGWIPPPHGS